MNKRKRVATNKHRKALKRLRERRQEAIKAGAQPLSKGQMHRKVGPAVPTKTD